MKYFLNKHWKINKDYNFDKLLYLLIDRPNATFLLNSIIGSTNLWLDNKNQYHRNYDLPAIAYNLSVSWFVENNYHRNDNHDPIHIHTDGTKQYKYNKNVS